MDHPEASQVLSVSTTVASRSDALRLARGLVEARLAACVQIDDGLTSVYRWEGRLCEDAELRLTLKTAPGRLQAIQAYFAEHHPYEVPQFLVSTMQASEAYGRWARDETAPPA